MTLNLNKVCLGGRLTAEPDVRYTTSGKAVAGFSLAINRIGADGQRRELVEYVDVVCWEKTAKAVAEHLTKGSSVYVEGRLQTRSYDDSEGVRRRRTEVVAGTVLFLDKKPAAK